MEICFYINQEIIKQYEQMKAIENLYAVREKIFNLRKTIMVSCNIKWSTNCNNLVGVNYNKNSAEITVNVPAPLMNRIDKNGNNANILDQIIKVINQEKNAIANKVIKVRSRQINFGPLPTLLVYPPKGRKNKQR